MSKPCFRNSLMVAAALVFMGAGAETAGPARGKTEPIAITSRSMVADKLGDKVTFLGDVVLKKEAVTLYSDTVIVFYDARSKGVREIEAFGNVVVRKEGRVALANRAIYYSNEEKIVLTGDARIIENENQLGGQKITLFMRDDRSIVEGGKVLLYQDKSLDEKRKGKKDQ